MDFLDITPVNLFNTNAVDKSQWQRCFFDLEGSLVAKGGNILQLGLIMTDWDFNIIGVHNEYFRNDNPISEEEAKIHGITEELIKRKAFGTFIQRLDELPLNVDKPTMFISYTTFDIRRVREEMKLFGVDLVDFGDEVESLAYNLANNTNCHYNAFRLGKKKADKVAEELGIDVFKDIYAELAEFGNFPIMGNHDALYDSVLILALCRRLNSGRFNERDDGPQEERT